MITRNYNRGFYGSRGATYSDCERYRYTLWDIWRLGKPQVNFLMLNPSTATELVNDPTIERCSRRARKWGYGGLWITNLFALRATDPEEMLAHNNPVGKQNDRIIMEVACKPEVERIICAWGDHGSHLGRSSLILHELSMKELDDKCYLLRRTRSGEPQHPLYVPYGLDPVMVDPYQEPGWA